MEYEKRLTALEELAAKEGPSRNILEPKSQAHKEALILRDDVIGAYRTSPSFDLLACLVRVYNFIGTVLVDLEDFTEGFKNTAIAYLILRACIQKKLLICDSLPPKEGASIKEVLRLSEPEVNSTAGFDYVFEYVTVMNSIGIYMSHSNSEQSKNDALKALILSEKAYRLWDKWFTTEAHGPSVGEYVVDDQGKLVADENAAPEVADKKNERFAMDLLYTKTVFFLCQAYMVAPESIAIGDRSQQTSKYIMLSLRFQLLTRSEFDAKEWATNALRLADHFIAFGDFECALYVMRAGAYIMPKTPDDESTTGTVEWAFGHLFLSRLDWFATSPSERARAGPARTRGGEGYFVELPLPVKFPSLPKITDFPSARDCFKEAFRHYTRAKEYYRFDILCSDYIHIQQDVSSLYRAVADFEQDPERCVLMHQARVDLFKGIAEQLNPQAYLTTIRQIYCDVANIKETILDIRIKQRSAAEEGKESYALSKKKINAINSDVVKAYDLFLSQIEGDITAKQDEAVRIAIFRVLLSLARLETKRYFASAKDEYDAVGRSSAMYKKVLVFAANNELEKDDSLATELKYAHEMEKMLTDKQRTIMQTFSKAQAQDKL